MFDTVYNYTAEIAESETFWEWLKIYALYAAVVNLGAQMIIIQTQPTAPAALLPHRLEREFNESRNKLADDDKSMKLA